MQTPKTYSFYITELRHAYSFLISLFGGLLLMIAIPVVFILNHQGKSIYIVYLTGFVLLAMTGGIAYSVWRWRKVRAKYTEPEKVVLRTDGLSSHYFGTILFEDISTYSIKQSLSWINWNAAAPALKIRLESGETIRFEPTLDQSEANKEEYLAYISDFTIHWAAYKQLSNQEERISMDERASSRPSEEGNEYAHAMRAITKAKKKRARKNIVIPFSLVIGVMLFSRIFGGKIIEYYKKKPLRDMVTYSQQRAEQYPILLRNAIAEEGGLYLYTNDTTATIRLVPYITNTPVEGLDLLNTLTADGHIMDFLIHKEDRDFLLQLEYANGTWEQILGAKSDNLNEEQSIYLLFSMNIGASASSEYNLIPAASFTYKTIEELENQLEKKQFLFEQGNRKAETDVAFKWYVLALENEGMTLEKFEEATSLLDKYFAQTEGVSSSFFLSASNGNGDPIGTPAEEITNPSIRDLQETIEIRQRIKEEADKNAD